MKVALLSLVLFLAGLVGFAQDSTSARLRRMYFQIGSTVPLSSDQTNVFGISLACETKMNILDYIANISLIGICLGLNTMLTKEEG